MFLKNLTYLKEHVSEDKIKVRVPIIKKLHKSNEAESSYKKLKYMGFKNIEIFDYIDDIWNHKVI